MKRISALLLAALMLLTACFAFTACGGRSDYAQIKEKGYFVCGITSYAPMNYLDDEGNLVGFDTEFAQAVAKELGLEAKFQIISWGSKYTELNGGVIDLIWNGFTYGDEGEGENAVSRTEYVDFTYAYLKNVQCIVTKTTDLEALNTKESFVGKRGAAEASSSGEAVAKELCGEESYTAVAAQSNALMELDAGTVDFVVIDYLMAKTLVGKDNYADLSINTAYEPEPEVYAIGCRKGSDLTAKINEVIVKLSENGKLAEIAAKYDLTNDLIEEIGK